MQISSQIKLIICFVYLIPIAGNKRPTTWVIYTFRTVLREDSFIFFIADDLVPCHTAQVGLFS